MSCEAVAAASLLWLASWSGAADTAPPAPAAAVAPASPLTSEPLFADIIARAGRLGAEVDGWKGKPLPTAEFAAFKGQVSELAALDMRGHVTLKERGTDGDLKCILRGISEDLPLKLKAVEDAANPSARDAALVDLSHLLRDNVEVITAPPAPPV
ncbi:MAG: hypothetical protein EON95_02065 [Caulobacteraceae bacterium]|nr:hypothetical protein [Caulobacter sp.]RYF95276.1 MAG: hypothetical protein EON95_02065 [Caulobacteraceae bacterium]